MDTDPSRSYLYWFSEQEFARARRTLESEGYRRSQTLLTPWVAFGILPIFAFANAGVPLTSGLAEALASPVAWGVAAGLLVGKPIGIALFSWLAVVAHVAHLPRAIEWRHIAGVACLGGVGFTISLFITELAFGENELAHAARVGIFIGSLLAGAAGYLVLRATLPPPRT